MSRAGVPVRGHSLSKDLRQVISGCLRGLAEYLVRLGDAKVRDTIGG